MCKNAKSSTSIRATETSPVNPQSVRILRASESSECAVVAVAVAVAVAAGGASGIITVQPSQSAQTLWQLSRLHCTKLQLLTLAHLVTAAPRLVQSQSLACRSRAQSSGLRTID